MNRNKILEKIQRVHLSDCGTLKLVLNEKINLKKMNKYIKKSEGHIYITITQQDILLNIVSLSFDKKKRMYKIIKKLSKNRKLGIKFPRESYYCYEEKKRNKRKWKK